MKILLTGSSGFVGRRLSARLVERGDVVLGTSLGPQPEEPLHEAVDVDLCRASAVADLAARFEPDIIVHLAGLSHVGRSWRDPARYFQVNVLGTENVLRSFPAKRVLLASSAEVYGQVPQEEQPIDELRSPAPESPYGLTKAAAERLVLGAEGVVLRFFSFIGAGQSRLFALPDFAAQLAASRGRQVARLEVGNLEARRAFVHVEDGVDGIMAVIDRGESGGVYNVAGTEAISMRQALDMLIAASGLEVDVVVDPKRFRPADIPVLSANLERLRALGWKPRRSAADAVSDIWRHALGA